MIEFLIEQAAVAHWYAFGLLMLAGLNIPISEDLVLIGSAVLAATVVPENFYPLLIAAFAGAYLSDIENYWLARILGPRLRRIKFFEKMLPQEKLDLVKGFMDRYGPLTLIFGRFVPFGVRNAQFTTAGLSKMDFWKFAFFDFVGCVLTTTVLFALGYSFGRNYELLLGHIGEWKLYIFGVAVAVVALAILQKRIRARRKEKSSTTQQ